mmetsp:Transcript_84867/g.226443  ORF Transcript_84867/g.226443 Transcript_84867/m.226443 type:complete len:84 (-) Transcript_84867:65-316(-)
MAYVAVSRARESKDLKMRGFTPGCVRVHPKVVEFAKWIESEQLCAQVQPSKTIKDSSGAKEPTDDCDEEQWVTVKRSKHSNDF